VYLKPELVAAFKNLDRRLTYDFKIFGECWHQGEPDGRFLVLPNEKKKQNLEGKRKKAKVPSLSDPCSHNYPSQSVKVIKMYQSNPHTVDQPSRIGIGIIAIDGRFIVYLLRKEEALALEQIVLEFERSQCITTLERMALEFKCHIKRSQYIHYSQGARLISTK